MAEQILNIEKVVGGLPTTLSKNTFYAVRVNNGYDLYLSDSTGSTAHRMNYDGWQRITDVQDLNEMRTTGKYFISIGGNRNAPFNGYIYVIVENAEIGTNERIIQTVYADSGVSAYWKRVGYNSNVWRAWETFENNLKPNNIGGRNLLMSTSKLTNSYYWKFGKHASQASVEQPRDDRQLTIETSSTNGDYWIHYYQRSSENPILDKELIPGKQYTVSFEAMATTTTDNYIRFFFRQYYTGGSNNSSRNFNVSKVNEWQKFEFTFTLQAKHTNHSYWQFILQVSSNIAGRVDIRNIKFEKGAVSTEYSPAYEDHILSKTDGRNLLSNSNPNVSNREYGHRFPLIKAPKVGEEFTVTLWGNIGVDRTGIGIFNTQGYTQLASLTKIADGVYQGVGKWDLPKKGTEVLTPNDTHLNVYFLPSSSTSINTIEKIKMELGTVGTDYTPAMEDFSFNGSSGGEVSRNGVSSVPFKKRWAKIVGLSPEIGRPLSLKHPFDRTKIISISYRIDTPNDSLVNNGLTIEVTNDEFRLNAMYIDNYYQNKTMTLYVEYEYI